MIIVNFPAGITEVTIPALNQWDYGQKIAIHGLNLPQITEVHFCDKTCDKALVRLANKILDDVASNSSHSEVAIPDKLLENPHAIHAFVFVKSYESAPGVTASTEGTFYTKAGDEYTAVKLPGAYVEGETYYRECGKVTYKINIPVIARTQPDGYPCEDESVQNFLDEAMARINDASAVIERQAYQSAKIYNIRDGQYYATWLGNKEEYKALSEEEKAALNTIFIYDNELKEDLITGKVVVKQATRAGVAATAELTDATNATWEESEIEKSGSVYRSIASFTGGNTYQVCVPFMDNHAYTFTVGVPNHQEYNDVIIYQGQDFTGTYKFYNYLCNPIDEPTILDPAGNPMAVIRTWKLGVHVSLGNGEIDMRDFTIKYRRIR